MSTKADHLFNSLQAAFDELVTGLSREDYKEVTERLHGHLSAVLDCIAEEDGEEE